MYKMYYAYYKGWGNGFKKKVATFFIKITTGWKFSHVEIEFPKELYKKNCFSSSGWDKGVRYKNINFSHPKRWYHQLIGYFTKEEIEEARECCDKFEGLPYEYKGVILRFGLGRKVDDLLAWWCSEISLHIGNLMGWFNRFIDDNLAPTRMFYRVRRYLKK